MSKTITVKSSDPCPGCGGAQRKCPTPTPEMRAAAVARDDSAWRPIPPHYDTAPQDVVDEHGALWVCTECGVTRRYKDAPAPAAV